MKHPIAPTAPGKDVFAGIVPSPGEATRYRFQCNAGMVIGIWSQVSGNPTPTVGLSDFLAPFGFDPK
jgi:hypothetical protein